MSFSKELQKADKQGMIYKVCMFSKLKWRRDEKKTKYTDEKFS